MDTAVLVLRTALSLAAVLGLIWYAGRKLNDSANGTGGDGFLARLVSGAGGTRRTGRRGQGAAVTITVVARQVLGAKASLAVVDVGDQRLVLGVTEGGVNVLSTQAVPALDDEDEGPGTKSEVREEITLAPVLTKPTLVPALDESVVASVRAASPLDSSILSPTTWRQTLSLMQGRTVRR